MFAVRLVSAILVVDSWSGGFANAMENETERNWKLDGLVRFGFKVWHIYL